MADTKFVVVGCARSGTTWLADLIDHHSMASCMQEPCADFFHHRVAQHRLFWEDDDVWICPRDNRGTYRNIGNYFADKIWTLPGQARGAKMLSVYFIRYHGVTKYLCGLKDLKVIWIHRNPIRIVLSLYHAMKLNNWNSEAADEIKPREPVIIQPKFFRERMHMQDRHEAALRGAFGRHQLLHVLYDQLLKSTESVMASVFEFLGLPQEDVTSKYHKMTQGEFTDLVINWKELRTITPGKWLMHWDESFT